MHNVAKTVLVVASSVVLLVLSLGVLYLWFASDSEIPTTQSPTIATEPAAKIISDLITRKEYDEAYLFGENQIMSEGFTDEELLELFALMISAETSGVRTSDETHQERVVSLYQRLLEFGNDEGKTDLSRATAYAQINRLFQQTAFNADYLAAALLQFEDGALYDEYKKLEYLDSEEGITYTALFRLNEKAESLYSDKINIGWQAWLVGTSMLVDETPQDLLGEFVLYVEEKLDDASIAEYKIENTVYQQIWLDAELLSLQWRLAEVYPDNYTQTPVTEIEARYDELLMRVSGIPQKTFSVYTGEYLVRISYANFLYENGYSKEKISEVLQPVVSGEFAQYSPGTVKWVESRRYEGEATDYLLESLYNISLVDDNLRNRLIQHGWVYKEVDGN